MDYKKTAASPLGPCLFIIFFIVNVLFAAPSPLDYKTFVSGTSLWICEPAGIMLYRNDTKSVRNIVLCDTVDNDSILEVAENSAVLWALSKSGIYQIDYTTTTVEGLPGEKKGIRGDKLAVDDDYVWVALNDTLWRFDKLSREWFPYPINSNHSPIFGVYSNGANVYCVLSSSVKIFSTKDEKWLEFPNNKGVVISSQSRFFLDKDVLLVIDGAACYRYLINSQSWDVVKAPSPVIDMLSQDTVLYYFTASGMFKYATKTFVVQPQDIPELSRVRNFSLLKDTLFCATNSNFIKYDMRTKAFDNIQPPQNIPDYTVLKTIILGGTLLVLCPRSIGVYNTSAQFWENVPLSVSGKKRKRILWDDDNGLKLNYARGYSSQLKGSLLKRYTIDSLINRTDSSFLYFSDPSLYAKLTLHTALPKGRYFDAFIDNTNLSEVARKGVFYRGASTDLVESARLGTNTIDIAQSKTLPTAQFEGAGAVLQSKKSLATRDRKIVKAQTGVGLFLSKTISKVFPYSDEGIYYLKGQPGDSAAETYQIIPGSHTVFIDGEEIDTSLVQLEYRNGSLSFRPEVPLDPTSVISISYQIRTVPNGGLREVEMLPENHYGPLGYGSVSVSPTDWISPQAGFFYMKTDSVHTLANVAAPAEIRAFSGALFLKINPEFTYDASTQKKAGALSLQSRFGKKLSLFTNALLADSGFKTTNDLSRGYGDLKHDADFKLAYDIKKELPVSYYQRDIASQNGVERRYELAAGAHFLGLPFCDVSLSRNLVDGNRVDTMSFVKTVFDSVRDSIVDVYADSAVFDTLDRLKDKFRVRLYETSSPFIEKALHLNRINYDVSYTGFTSKKEHQEGTGYGSIIYGNASISPLSRLTLTINGRFLNNPAGSVYGSEYTPTFILQTIDAPPGVELALRNQVDFKSLSDSAQSMVSVQRIAGLTLKPGTWTKYLRWISPILSYSQSVSCSFDERSPGIDALLLGNRNITKQNYTPGIGANIFPTNDIIFYDKNEWTTADSSTKYFALNDLKWWFGQRRMWQTRWQYIRDRPRFTEGITRDNHSVTSQFTSNWSSLLQTIFGAAYDYTSTDSTKMTKIGPKLAATFNKQKFSFVRDFMNSHTLNIFWITNNGETESSPEIAYALNFKIILFPNISFDSQNQIGLSKGKLVKLNCRLDGTLIF